MYARSVLGKGGRVRNDSPGYVIANKDCTSEKCIQGTCQMSPGSFVVGFDYCSMTTRCWQLDMGCLGGVKKVPKTIHLLTFMIPTFGICTSPHLPERPPLLPAVVA